jgi:hypothetical protein
MLQKWHARFHGRPVGAIGTFRTLEAFVTGADEKAAALALYETHEHISDVQLTPLALRYVATFVNRDGMRTLMSPAQGRHTYPKAADAQTWIDAVLANNHADTLSSIYGNNPQPEVRPCWCWPGHFDPIGVYFD